MTKSTRNETNEQALQPLIDPAPIPPAPLVFPQLLRKATPAEEEIKPVDPYAYTDIVDIVRVPAGFTCSVKFVSGDDYLPYLACPDDVEAHGRAIYADCAARQANGVPDYFPTDAEVLEATQERMARELRRANSAVVKYQDRVDVGRASDADIALLLAWKTYRVDLNELPDTEKFPYGLTWPLAPDIPAI
ncbi:tail fiber assembly protein [Collimonas fungivorans]|uniref:tail fiber assembly protein n=1 Tax=Collimonas fungivorans TaxID=158899 RepID=UPI003FA3DADB